MSKPLSILLLAAMTVLLSACGGGGGYSDPAPPPVTPPPAPPSNEVPTSATASVQAYVQYAGSLAASDSAEPLDVSKVTTPPTTETEEPQPVS